MKPAAVAAAVLLVAAGYFFVQQRMRCVGSFGFTYTMIHSGPILPDTEYCREVTKSLVDLDTAATNLGETIAHPGWHWRVDVRADPSGRPVCRVAYRGRDRNETSSVLRELATLFTDAGVVVAGDRQIGMRTFLREQIVILGDRRVIAETPESEPLGHLGGYALDTLDERRQQLEELLADSMAAPPEEACVEYLDSSESASASTLATLAARCATSTPAAIVAWPALAAECK